MSEESQKFPPFTLIPQQWKPRTFPSKNGPRLASLHNSTLQKCARDNYSFTVLADAQGHFEVSGRPPVACRSWNIGRSQYCGVGDSGVLSARAYTGTGQGSRSRQRNGVPTSRLHSNLP